MKRLLLLLSCLPTVFLVGQVDSSAFLVLPYLQFSTQNSITILWETQESTSGKVSYGPALLKAEAPNLSLSKESDSIKHLHEVRLDDLEPETFYFWRVEGVHEDGSTFTSPTYTFKTAVKDSSGYLFALIGDSQRNEGTPWAWSVISTKVWQKRPNFVIHAGDLVDWGPRKSDWTEHFFPGGHDLMSRIPMYTVMGNHEGDADYYYEYMANPKPEQFYTFKYGNAEFFMIDTNRDVAEGSDQYNWLDQALAQSTATWKFAIHHHPPYSSEADDHGDTNKSLSTLGTKARDLCPLFDKYGVDFSLFGHTHVYERSWPLKNNRINQKEGVVYINSGGAGGFLEDFAPTRSWFTLELQRGHHFCTFAIFDKTLVFKAIDHEGRVFDTFQMEKDGLESDAATVVRPPAPLIQGNYDVFEENVTIKLEPGLSDLSVYYTLDGSEPSQSSNLYQAPFVVSKTTTIRARSFTQNGKTSRINQRTFTQSQPMLSAKNLETQPGLRYRYYEGDWRENKAHYFSKDSLKKEGVMKMLDLKEIGRTPQEYWGIIIDGYLEIPETGSYIFYALDSRGLEILLDGQSMIQSEGERQTVTTMVLEKGKHAIQIKSFQRTWRQSLGFGFYDPIFGRVPFKPFQLSH